MGSPECSSVANSPNVKLERTGPRTFRTTIGGDQYALFPCSWSDRIRWVLKNWRDDGFAIRTHGAEKTLSAAIEAIWGNHLQWEEVRHK